MSFGAGFAMAAAIFGNGGGGTVGKLKAIVDDGAANLSVILTDSSTLAEYTYTYIAKTITASVTTSVTSGETTTTRTKSWSKYLIDKLYDVSGSMVAQAVYSDEEKGIVSHYLDSNNNIIYIDGGYSAEGLETGAELIGANINAVAIAYTIARNQESASALQDIKKAYREGVKRGNDGVDNDDYVDEVIDDDGNTPIEPPMDEDNPDNADKRGTDMYYTVQSGEGETAETYYVRIYTQNETGENYNDTRVYKYAWTYTLAYDLYDSEGKAISAENGISTYYSNLVAPSNAWYFKTSYINYRYENSGYNIYMYVEKVEFVGQTIIVHYVTIHAKTGETQRGTSTTIVNVPEGATVVHTNSEKPF